MFHTLGFIVALVWKLCCVIPSRHDSTTIQEDRCHHQLAVSATLANSTAFWQSSHQHLLKHGILYNFFPRSSKHINELLLVGAVQKKVPFFMFSFVSLVNDMWEVINKRYGISEEGQRILRSGCRFKVQSCIFSPYSTFFSSFNETNSLSLIMVYHKLKLGHHWMLKLQLTWSTRTKTRVDWEC